MINGIQLKICGLTSVRDATEAARIGADYLGFIFYPKSLRSLSLQAYHQLSADLPTGPRRVAVMVEPSVAELADAVSAGFDHFQIHFAHTTTLETVRAWSAQVGSHRLWLAPKLPPAEEVAAAWLSLAGTFLLDTFHTSGFGGSGQTGDWAKFTRHQQSYAQHTWILAGGLSPANVIEAIAQSGTHFVDVNSGVEVSPGVKDHAKLRGLADVLSRS